MKHTIEAAFDIGDIAWAVLMADDGRYGVARVGIQAVHWQRHLDGHGGCAPVDSVCYDVHRVDGRRRKSVERMSPLLPAACVVPDHDRAVAAFREWWNAAHEGMQYPAPAVWVTHP